MSNADETLGWSTLPLGTVLRTKYRIDRVLGVGGTAVVYAVTHRNRRRFALKMLRPDLSARPDVRSRFVREGYVANTVEHPSVVDVLDDDVDERGSVFLVMELLDGLSLDQLCAAPAPALPAREALELADQVLDAIEHAHRKGIVHRDIKPSNLFLTRDGHVKVLDFGIARLRDASLEATHTGATLGTPAFMAPEQASAEPCAVDARADVWAVGATLFTLLSGRHVHEGDDAQEVLARRATEAPRSLASVMPDAPPALVALIDGALRADPRERFASAAAMREAVHAAARSLYGERPHGTLRALVGERLSQCSEPPTPRGPSPVEQSFARDPTKESPKASRRKRNAGAAAALAIALGVGVLATLHRSSDEPLEEGANAADTSREPAKQTQTEKTPSSASEPRHTSASEPPAPATTSRELESSPSNAAPAIRRFTRTQAPDTAAAPAVSAAVRANPLDLEIQ